MKTFVKYMKIAFSIFIVFLLGAIAYFVVINQEGLDRTYFSWLEKDVQKSDSYQYGFHIMTVEKETGDLRIMDKGMITVFRDQQMAKIVVEKSEYKYFESNTVYWGEESTYSGRTVYYIEIIDDVVYLYIPDWTNTIYSVETYDQFGLAEAVSELLFSYDVDFLVGEFIDLNFRQGRPHTTPNVQTTRMIDASALYEPFQIIRGDSENVGTLDVSFDRFSVSTQGSGAVYSIGEGEEIERIFKSFYLLNSFTITLDDTQDLYAYAYETLTGQVYDNGLDGVDCEQMMVINFYSDRHDAEPFNLPNIK